MSTRRWAATVAAAVLTTGLLVHPGPSAAAPPDSTIDLAAGQTASSRSPAPRRRSRWRPGTCQVPSAGSAGTAASDGRLRWGRAG